MWTESPRTSTHRDKGESGGNELAGERRTRPYPSTENHPSPRKDVCPAVVSGLGVRCVGGSLSQLDFVTGLDLDSLRSRDPGHSEFGQSKDVEGGRRVWDRDLGHSSGGGTGTHGRWTGVPYTRERAIGPRPLYPFDNPTQVGDEVRLRGLPHRVGPSTTVKNRVTESHSS